MNTQASLYRFIDSDGSFESENPEQAGSLYFPLVNEAGLLSAITPELKGDIKLDQHTFLTIPVSFDDLHLSRASRAFWVRRSDGKVWCLTQGPGTVTAGFLWHQVKRANKALGLSATVLNFVPAEGGTVELMTISIRNDSKKTQSVTGISAIALFGRSADNLRDHRHVTSLLHRVSKTKYGMSLCPTMSFNERGHQINKTTYYVVGIDHKGRAPQGVFPTLMSFIGDGGSLDAPRAVFDAWIPRQRIGALDQGKEAIGALQFLPIPIRPHAEITFTLALGIQKNSDDVSSSADRVMALYKGRVSQTLLATQTAWKKHLDRICFRFGDKKFNSWMRWVQLQPTLRKIFGCSFLPDFDYGKGGRGWRDLWQDCLALLLFSPDDVRTIIVNNFGGVRIDGSNATILTKNGDSVEFIADRNNITRTWMDHGVWPFLTTKLYLDQTGDYELLLEKAPYFRDGQLRRAQKRDPRNDHGACVLTDVKGQVYSGSVLEHMLVQHLVQFFNVGEHNIIRLEDADWNDGLDMAHQRGESVAFTHAYAGNFESLADLLVSLRQKLKWRFVTVAKELLLLLDRHSNPINYDSVDFKKRRLDDYYSATESGISGETVDIPIDEVIDDLRSKAKWMRLHLNRQEWVAHEGHQWFNGYYDNQGRQVEGKDAEGRIRMTLTAQVYPILSGTLDDEKVPFIIDSVNKYLFDKSLGGFRLNTNFQALQPDLGRAFSFVYGEKENGAVFSHMVVMYANALYSRGFVKEGFLALQSLYSLSTDKKSKIFPGLPEYFNNEGQGRYHYLTGSASWMVLTMLTQVFGVRGFQGDLVINPKLDITQFDTYGLAEVAFYFAQSRIQVKFLNPKRVPFEKWAIGQVIAERGDLRFDRLSSREVRIPRTILQSQKNWNISVELKEIEK